MVRKLGLALTLFLGGCAWSTAGIPPSQGPSPTDAVVANSGQQGNRAITVNLVAPSEGSFTALSAVHRWVDADIFQYEVSLKVKNGSEFLDFPTPLMVVVPRKDTPKTRAVFTNLKQGSIYQVQVTAKGNVGGSAPDALLNAVPATALFDFAALQDVEDTVSADLRIGFDPVNFNGTGSADLLAPVDGDYLNPTAPETGTAQ